MLSDSKFANQLNSVTENILNECVVASATPSKLLDVEFTQKLGDTNEALRNSQKFDKMLAKYDKKTGKIIC